jgi:thiamine pyrophosphate-dependent acetolactate synthase large subunit-like protein
MAETAADVLMETLHDCGVEVIFGLSGDGINGLINARAATTLTRVAGHAHRP